MAGIGNTMTQLGSDATAGVMAWTATMLQNATWSYPTIPVVDAPTTNPGPVAPAPDPDGPPGWYLPLGMLAILAMEALNQTMSPVPARDPFIPRVAVH